MLLMLTAAAAPESGSVAGLDQAPAGATLSKLSEESESAAADESEENDVRLRSEYRLTCTSDHFWATDARL